MNTDKDVAAYLASGGIITQLPSGHATPRGRIENRSGVVADVLTAAPDLGTLLSNSDIYAAFVPVHLQMKRGTTWRI